MRSVIRTGGGKAVLYIHSLLHSVVVPMRLTKLKIVRRPVECAMNLQ